MVRLFGCSVMDSLPPDDSVGAVLRDWTGGCGSTLHPITQKDLAWYLRYLLGERRAWTVAGTVMDIEPNKRARSEAAGSRTLGRRHA